VTRSVVTYQDFSGGQIDERGTFDSSRAPKNSFFANNMLVTTDGTLRPRAGVTKINPAGLVNGVVHGFGNTPVPSNDLFFVQGTAVRTFSSAGSNLKTSGTALASIPTVPVDWKMDTTSILIASAADKLYRITPETGATVPTVAGLTGSPGARCIEVYGDRIVAGYISGSNAYRIRYSDVADPNSWPAGNFVDIGDNWGVYGLHAQRQHLAILKQNGIHVLTGSLGSSQTLRKVSSGDGILHPAQARMGAQDRLWLQEWPAAYPSHFNGAAVSQVPHLEYSTTSPGDGSVIPPSHGVAPLAIKGGGAVYVDQNEGVALFLNGVWTYHTFAVPVSGYVASNGRYLYFCDGGAAGATPKFHLWDLSTDASGSGSYAGDASTTPLSGSVTFPEWWSEDGSEVTVRSVIVDFYNHGASSAFSLTAKALRKYQGDASTSSTTVTYTASGTGTSRRVFGFGEQGMGGGFQLSLTACKLVGIASIQVIIDTQPARV
jgi:hypothetical protein